MNAETRFLALVTALLMMWVVTSAVRELGESPTPDPPVSVAGATQPSDLRLKEDIHDLDYGLRELLGLRPVSYRYKNFPSQPKIGFVAQEVQAVVPEVVYLSPADPESIQPRYYSINYGELVPVLVRSIQEQQEIIRRLQGHMDAIEALPTQ